MKNWNWLLIALLLTLTLFLPKVHGADQKQTPITLTYSNFFTPREVHAQLGDTWSKEIEKRTHGKVKINYYPGGTLVKGDQIYQAALQGGTDIGMSVFSYTVGNFPGMEAIDLPLGYGSGKAATWVINDFYRIHKPKELAGVKVLYLHAHGPALLHSKKLINRLKDLKGMKIRSTGLSAKIIKALGAVPVAMSQEETFLALKNNVVDATFSPMEVLKGWKQAEVIKYTIDDCCIGYTSGMYVVMNLKKWSSLSPDIQKVFDEVSWEWVSKHGEAWDIADEEGRKFTLSLGNKVAQLDMQEKIRWVKAIHPVIDGYITEATQKGVPGKEYVETIKEFIGQYNRK